MVTGSHLLNRLSSSAWYILPQNLLAYEQILTAKFLNNEDFNSVAKDILTTYNLNSSRDSLSAENDSLAQIIDRKALINIEGTLMAKAGFLDAMCGFVGMNQLTDEINSLAQDARIDHIVLNWDSPGGTVSGTPQLTDAIYNARETKRVTSFISGEMASGAYFAGSAADEIYASSEVDLVGHIGVYTLHVDQSKADADRGLKFTYIKAGSHKVDGNPHEPLIGSALEAIQKMVDFDYEVFLKAIERNRSMSREDVLKMADGQIFKAGAAVGFGMIDGITSLDNILRS